MRFEISYRYSRAEHRRHDVARKQPRVDLGPRARGHAVREERLRRPVDDAARQAENRRSNADEDVGELPIFTFRGAQRRVGVGRRCDEDGQRADAADLRAALPIGGPAGPDGRRERCQPREPRRAAPALLLWVRALGGVYIIRLAFLAFLATIPRDAYALISIDHKLQRQGQR